MNDNELSMTPFWARTFYGESPESLRCALGVLAGLLDEPQAFKNVAMAVDIRVKGYSENRVSVAQILRETCAKYGLTMDQMLSPSHRYWVSHPRQEAMFRVYTECPHISYPEMGRRIGGKDHTTCLHGVRAHCARIGLPYEDATKIRNSNRKEVRFA